MMTPEARKFWETVPGGKHVETEWENASPVSGEVLSILGARDLCIEMMGGAVWVAVPLAVE